MNLRGMQREGSRFSPAVGSDVVDHTKVPAELQCPHCKKLFNDVVVTPCCGESYCDECIRNYLIEHDLTCLCGETTSPDNLIANKSLRTAVNNFRNQKKSDLKSVPPSPDTQQSTTSITNGSSLNSIENQPSPQPATSTEADVVSAQNPPDIHSETSQSSDTAQLSVPSPKVGDLAVMNSPKKQVIEDGKAGMVNQGMVVQPQILSASQAIIAGQVQPRIVPGSQAFHTAAGTAVYTGVHHNAMRANYLLPQQQILQSSALLGPTIQYGINMPGGATLVKRLVPVPVGPRLAVSQVPHSGIPHGSVVPVDLNKQLLEQHGRPARKDKEKGDVESPMPLTEDEFYLWQNQFKQRRHLAPPVRETSRERHRSRSKSPTGEKRRRHRDKSMSHSADESSQERKKKREKKRHRDSSQESRGESAKSKSRSERKYSSKKSSRHLPKHIKRELEEFEFDNELEFDEELRKVRKQSKKKSRSDFEYDDDFDNELHKLRKESKRKNKRSKETENTPNSTKSASVERNSSVSPEPNENKDASNEPAVKTEVNASETSKEVGAVVLASTQDTENNKTETTDVVKENKPKPETDATATENKPKKRTKIVRKIVKRVVKVKKRKGEIMSKTVISSGPALSEQIVPTEQTPIEKITPATDSGISADAKKSDNTETPSSESALPENSRWETGEKKGVEKSPEGNTHEENNATPVKKAKTLFKTDVTPKTVAGTSGRSQALVSPQKKASELRSRKEAQKRAIIEKAKKLKMLSESLEGEDEETKKKREKYLLLKQKKLKERAAKLKKGVKQDKANSLRNTAEHSDEGRDDPEERSKSRSKEDKLGKKPDQHFYKPGDAKLKSISEMSKQRLKQVETRRAAKKEVENGEGDDVLKSKVTSIKKMITEKRRVIKTSVSEEEKEFTTSQSSEDIRRSDHRVVRIENKKKALSSAVEKTGQEKRKHKQHEDSSERRHREKSLERERKTTTDRDRAERRLLREEEERKEAKRQRQLERERKERKKVSILEQEKQESLQREKLALREKDRLERKLMRERELREELMREKEEEKFRRKKQELVKRKRINLKDDDSDETSSKKSRRHKEVIKIDVSEKSEEESSESEKEKKKKKRSKKKKEKKKRRKKSEESDDENNESADSDDSSSEDDDEEEERKRKKKKRKHKRKHKKHRKSKKHKKKTKKKKTKKEKSESESEEEQESESKKSDTEEEDEEVEESEQKSEESDNAKESKSASSEDESVKSSSDQNEEEKEEEEEEEEETESKTEITEKSATDLETETEKNDDSSKAKCEKTKEKTENEPPVGKVKKKSSTGDAEDLELDYDEDIGDLDNDALYGDLNFADDEQTNPENTDEERADRSPEDGEILDEDLFSMKPNTVEKNLFSTEPNDTDIENAVDDAINELSLDISNRKNAVRKVEKSSDVELILKNENSKNR
ncbi:golgin subfamily A member 6-like protein 24 isoform X2 [Hydractinia symbiolongicarpus]|nr:golgin subfamily A member 6-like protein 24 isoform X2 [Hydractinia symbiolongicarpus]